jgi:hypothetical protein
MKTELQIKLSPEQEREAEQEYAEYLREHLIPEWKEFESSPDEMEEDKVEARQRFRLLAYHKACLKRVYSIFKNKYGSEFATLATKIDDFGDLEAAQRVTKLVIDLEKMVFQGATRADIQKKINPFSSEYKRKLLEKAERELKVAQAKAEEAAMQRQAAQERLEAAIQGTENAEARLAAKNAEIAFYTEKLATLEALKMTQAEIPGSTAGSKPVMFSSQSTLAPSDDLGQRLGSLDAAHSVLQDNGVGSSGDRKRLKTTAPIKK